MRNGRGKHLEISQQNSLSQVFVYCYFGRKPPIARLKCLKQRKDQPLVISDASTGNGKDLQLQLRCSGPYHFLIATLLASA